MVIALIGEPASGKTSIVREIIRRMSPGVPFKSGLVYGTSHIKEKLLVLGKYAEGDVFSGTDQFSMAVQPEAEFWLQQFLFRKPDWSILFEGDRLGNKKFLKYCSDVTKLQIFLVLASEEKRSTRHVERKDSQSETFLKSRKTKVENILKEFPDVMSFYNNTPTELSFFASTVIKYFMDN